MKKAISIIATLVIVLGATFTFSGIGELTSSIGQNSNTILAQSGCCSHHGGVCGCSSSGRTECCDGTLSPSCGC